MRQNLSWVYGIIDDEPHTLMHKWLTDAIVNFTFRKQSCTQTAEN
jgi:hypothetical protein